MAASTGASDMEVVMAGGNASQGAGNGGAGDGVEAMAMEMTDAKAAESSLAMDAAVHVEELSYDYGGEKEVLFDVSLDFAPGTRTLLVGLNGTGKTTLLRILAGKHLVKHPVVVLGKDAYRATPRGLTFLGAEWAHNPVVRKDVVVADLIVSMGGNTYPDRRDELLALLGVEPTWRMHKVSDGQRRRVQLLLGLLKPWTLLLLDEVTVDLDVLVRHDLMAWLRHQTETRGATVVYATHIFDGLGDWATHVVHLCNGAVRRFVDLGECEELETLARAVPVSGRRSFGASPLLQLIEAWLSTELAEKKAAAAAAAASGVVAEPTPLQAKAEDVNRYGDKFYNYWG
ncbi:CCR4-Not complex subunit Caf16 [Thecamonas trahens ATCC 50062]|uniref:CCR4-Not complex subunit Caf16 n=1 Tax=Thecamonas trahens ATCC 50062 TaxID=461836 RepID=A0A0L0DNK3_THETB|nr:CCR4-Not complex subunit Caf16 [Thecamonas trahens ATCC 50062]KNC53894.1 CCR4-Not complex subunit Caf16 [Thecamonas trahens ATCC 50062]|eukprot:XP_013754270.1 CCR4-Not complex subunit Caf16 [Thecamonas trahens ATCC 50062]